MESAKWELVNKNIRKMLQKYHQEQKENYTRSPTAHLNAKDQILQLLALKQCIYQYETGPNGRTDTVRTDIEIAGLQARLPGSPNKRKRPHRRLQSKNNTEGRFEDKKKSQSERVFKKREAIEMNKKQLKSSLHLQSRKQRTQSSVKGLTFKKRFNSIHVGENKDHSRVQNIHKRAETISYAKMKVKDRNQIEIQYSTQIEMRLKTFMTKYRSNYKLEKNMMKETDLQHRHIQELANSIRADKQTNVERAEQKTEEEEVKVKQSNPTLQQFGKVVQKRRNKQKGPLKGLLKERYQIIERIGKGLSGEVYKGKDILSERFVAIKVSDFNDKKESEYQFYKKVQHKNIVNYLNNFTERAKRYLVLEYLPHNLETLTRKRKLNEEQARRVFRCLVSALMFLHGLAIAHRDIKMENIVCSEDLAAIKFIDFGLCIDINEENSQLSQEFCGTVSYMPPEIFQRKPYDPKKADIWSLGVLLYKLVFDRYPYRGKDEREMLFKITRTKVVYPEYCNEDLKHLLERMLNRNASNRFSISEVIEHRWLL